MSTPARLIAYCRVSTDEQADDGYSLTAQADAIAAALSADPMSTVTATITDAGESASSLDRPGIRQALDMLAAGEADGLVVANLSRLTRSVRDLMTLLDWFDRHELSLRMLDLGVDTRTPSGRAMATVMGAVAEMMLGMTREATRAAFYDGSEPLRKLDAARPRVPAEVAERIRSLHASGMSYAAIARALNDDGVPTARGGTEWRHTTVMSVLGVRRPPRPKSVPLPTVRRSARRRVA